MNTAELSYFTLEQIRMAKVRICPSVCSSLAFEFR